MSDNVKDDDPLVKDYLLYGLPLADAKICAQNEINHKEFFKNNGKEIIKQIDAEAVAYNKKIRELKKLTKQQIAFKKQLFSSKTKNKSRRYNHSKPVTDPNGVYFKTTSSMCQSWGVLLPTYCNRLAKGWSIKDALLGKNKSKRNIKNTA